MTSENTHNQAPQQPDSTSENTTRRRGARPTPLPERLAELVDDYAAALAAAPVAAATARTYLSRVRQYLAWLDHAQQQGLIRGNPLTFPTARDWAVRDYRTYLLREADPKKSQRYVNTALAALDDFYTRQGLGKATVAREQLPQSGPRALGPRAQLRWLRAAADAGPRDKALAFTAFYAGLRIGDAVALDVDDVATSARKGVLTVYGKGGRVRQLQLHPELRKAVDEWKQARRDWPGAEAERALFINQRGRRLSPRAGGDVFTKIAAAADLDPGVTAHVLRHTMATTLIRGGTDLVTVAETLGHARLETTRRYSLPTEEDRARALDLLPTDR